MFGHPSDKLQEGRGYICLLFPIMSPVLDILSGTQQAINRFVELISEQMSWAGEQVSKRVSERSGTWQKRMENVTAFGNVRGSYKLTNISCFWGELFGSL